MNKVTLGGDRLGTGRKMQVDLHGYERSTHDLSYVWRSTMSAGTLVPFMSEVALPGDTFDIKLFADMNTHPTAGPLFGSFKMQLDVFLAPFRLYNSWLHNNKLKIGLKMSDIKIPQLELSIPTTGDQFTDIDNIQINPSCLLSYLNIRGGGINLESTRKTRLKNALSYVSYFDIYKNYYANKSEGIGAMIHTPSIADVHTVDTGEWLTSGTTYTMPSIPNNGVSIPARLGTTFNIQYTGATPVPEQILYLTAEKGYLSAAELAAIPMIDTGTQLEAPFRQTYWGDLTILGWKYKDNSDANNGKPAIHTFDLEEIDFLREEILSTPGNITYTISGTDVGECYRLPLGVANNVNNSLSSQEGLLLKTYNSDLFNNWLDTETITGTNGISEITAVDTSDGFFTIDTLNLSKKVYLLLNRIAISGGSYDDWMNSVWDHQGHIRATTPMYMGGLIQELVFQEVVSQSLSAEQPLGTLAGRGRLQQNRKGGDIYIKVDEPSYIIGIISLTPRIDYSQGNKWDTELKTMDELHKPQLDEIGFQDLSAEQLAWWSTKWNNTTSKWEQVHLGKQPAWINYMTNVNQVRGNFAIPDNEMFMTLNRRYEYDLTTHEGVDFTTYIDPSKFNFIFAQTSLDAQNFWAQIGVNITARRKMSAKIIPNL